MSHFTAVNEKKIHVLVIDQIICRYVALGLVSVRLLFSVAHRSPWLYSYWVVDVERLIWAVPARLLQQSAEFVSDSKTTKSEKKCRSFLPVEKK